jgi:hypothetical protein
MQLGTMFISNCNNTQHVSDAIGVHPQERLKTQYDLVQKPSTLDALTGYFTTSHVKHQRLSLRFLSAPEDGRKYRPKHVEYYCSY